MYADDTKIYREIKAIEDQTILQSDLDTLTRWSDVWLLKFHPEKCFHLSIGKNEEHESNYHMNIDNVKHDMTHIGEIKDIGVVVDNSLKFEKHINAKIETTNKILGIIRRTYMFLNMEIFIPLYKALVCSHFDYAMSTWNPHMIKHIEPIESVQRRATKLVPKIKNLTYPDKLRALNLPTLSYRRLRGDMIEVYKIIANIYDSNTCQNILNFRQNKGVNLRGHQYTLEHKRLYTASRVNYFANRVVKVWNSLPEKVVGAGTLNMFKNSLDRLWSKQELVYDYRSIRYRYR